MERGEKGEATRVGKRKLDSADREEKEKRMRREEGGCGSIWGGKEDTDIREGSTVWYNHPPSIFSIIHYLSSHTIFPTQPLTLTGPIGPRWRLFGRKYSTILL